jgi:glycosyltransferase involved in cell wall biosynthesis
MKAGNASLVYASMSPFSSALAAARVAARLDVPWVADLRDPWALDEYFAYPTRVHWSLERRAMRQRLASAAAVILPTPGTHARLVEFFPEYASRAVHIPNGFDPADFEGPASVRTDDVFHIVHSGYSYGDVGRRRLRRVLGGTDTDVDLFPRSPAFLLAALDRLVERHPDLRSKIRLHLAGPLTPTDERLLIEARCRDMVQPYGYLPHAEAVDLVRSADLLFLPMHKIVAGPPSTIVPGKLYEYLATGRPILAAIPPGDAKDLLDRTEWTVVCEPDDVDAMAEGLISLMQVAPERRNGRADRRELLEQFERPRLAARLADVFDDVTRGASPGGSSFLSPSRRIRRC